MISSAQLKSAKAPSAAHAAQSEAAFAASRAMKIFQPQREE